MKRTLQPKKLPKLKKSGFRNRMKTKNGKNIISRRRAKGRTVLSASDDMRKKNKTPKNKIK
ncbi:MAG: 50S ribosomal protein L34 [bacterium]